LCFCLFGGGLLSIVKVPLIFLSVSSVISTIDPYWFFHLPFHIPFFLICVSVFQTTGRLLVRSNGYRVTVKKGEARNHRAS
jgi:hypothetical protein